MSSNPRIFHLITRLIGGGAVNGLIPIATELDGYNVTVGYGSEVDHQYVELLQKEGADTKQFNLIRHYNPITAAPAVLSVANFIRQNDFDIVHTHSTEAGIIGRAAARLAGTSNVVHTIHGVPFSEDRNNLLNWFVERSEVAAAPWTDAIISIADIISEEYLSRGIGRPEQYQTIRYGIDLDKFSSGYPASDLPDSEVQVLMVSRLARGKGFEVLLDATEELAVDGVSILIAGDGPLSDELSSEIEARGLEETVHLLGYRDDIPAVMAACDMLVLPSFREGTPFVIIEAMAAGLPVVATDIAGIPEQVDPETNGILIEPGNTNALSDAIARLATSPELRERFGMASRKRAQQFSMTRMQDDYASVYADLLDSNR
ncbi:Glycosyltransferase involved in cell wall bisynthesis [Natronoarchaeum philippinense]|uniref:Glycosyltransferase involved in cell wall bisynthesis n=1 Tax=Natronoarchaeum philippinense TaxID=558529 RepID=A0A285P265_NATPI|nr:glycosyltransferase family 4 protein [Natronoarchaeum philippinense]SNZ15377.1 Glycosyltransferase involved in cell wall bisynthesis [Natronoarchaeum philippinense]